MFAGSKIKIMENSDHGPRETHSKVLSLEFHWIPMMGRRNLIPKSSCWNFIRQFQRWAEGISFQSNLIAISLLENHFPKHKMLDLHSKRLDWDYQLTRLNLVPISSLKKILSMESSLKCSKSNVSL